MKYATFLMLALTAFLWTLEHRSTVKFQAEIARFSESTRELAAAREEHQRLMPRQISQADYDALARHAMSARPTEPPAAATTPVSLGAVGEWTSSATWRNRGQRTPDSALETALFAAAGGDVALFASLVELPDEVRAEVEQLRAGLPAAERESYPTPETLVSALAIKRIPVGDAQLVWSQPMGNDTAAACLYLRNPVTPTGAVDLSPEPAVVPPGDQPPQLPPNARSKPVALSLHRTGDAWRLVVPITALKEIRQEFGARTN